ncbi:MAG: VCBS repeat-containing protein [Deltaproteobacteria bacterium]|nr:VCBS repeat-containing protein [Deltaproteobacteria bacterium]
MLIPLHPRMMADVNADGRADIVGFNNTGAFVSLSTLGPFTVPQQWEGNFGYLTGGWRAGAYPRLMADVTGDRRADIIGFGHAGVYVARSTGTSFTTLALWNSLYGYSSLSGGWRVDKHPRMLADVNADGRADVVGFGNSGVSVSLSTGTSFTAAQLWVANYGYNQGWRIDQHPRIMADVNGDRRADIVGFGSAGVYVSLSTGTGFTAPALWNNLYGSGSLAGGWRVDRHPRMMADVNGDRRADIVGFGNTGVSVSFSTGTSFTPAQLLVAGFGYNAGGWRVEAHPRTMADVNGDGRADIIGFGNNGVGGALSLGTSFAPPQEWINPGFGYNTQGFRVGRHPRLVADVNADGRADIIGIGNGGSRARSHSAPGLPFPRCGSITPTGTSRAGGSTCAQLDGCFCGWGTTHPLVTTTRARAPQLPA